MPISMPSERSLPHGPRRRLTQALHSLYRDAGAPAVQKISNAIADDDGFSDMVSHQTVSELLKGRVTKWPKLQATVQLLSRWAMSKPDPDEVERRFHDLWAAAMEEIPRPVANGPRHEDGRKETTAGQLAGAAAQEPHGRMDTATMYRLVAVDVTKIALNAARSEINRQIMSGNVNPAAVTGVADQDGFPPTKIDTYMDDLIVDLIREKAPRVKYYHSEERPRNFFAEDGDILAWCDPLDGTTNAFTFFNSFAIVIFFEQSSGSRSNHLAGAIASSDGSIVSWQHFRNGAGEVWIDWPGHFNWVGSAGNMEPHLPSSVSALRSTMQIVRREDIYLGAKGILPLRGGVPTRFAAVASTPRRRADVLAAFDFDSEVGDGSKANRPMFSALAGNPLVGALMLGELGGIVEPRSIKLHDAAFLVPLVLAGGIVVDYDGNAIDVLDVFEQREGGRRRIGPFIATADAPALEWILGRRRPAS